MKEYNDKFRNGVSEIAGDLEHATHIHHIFPAGEYPEISYYLENLIALTPNQHLNYAHPDGKTTVIDREYQYTCLIVKTDIIREALEQEANCFYSFSDFLRVLYIGLNEETFLEIENNDYNSIKTKLDLAYLV